MRQNSGPSNAFVNPPGLCIVTVCKNDCKNLLKTIKSLLMQVETEAESPVFTTHIIMDGASTDGTLDILKRYSSLLYNISYSSQPDCGIYDAMNNALRLVPADSYILFLNAGDILFDAHTISDLHAAIRRYVGYDIISLPFGYINDDIYWDICGFIDMPKKVRNGALVCQQSLLYHCRCFDGMNSFDKSLKIAGDYDHLLRLIDAGVAIVHHPRAAVKYQSGGISEVHHLRGLNEIRTSRQAFSHLFSPSLTYS